jgi:hypothetical protein
MARYAGTALYVKFGSTVMSGDHRVLKTSEKADSIDATAGADTRKTILPGLAEGDASLSMLGTIGGTAPWAAVAPRTNGTLEWAPEGTAAGKPKYTVDSYVLGRDASYPYNDVVSWEIKFGMTGNITAGTY